jgi:hypothetical protein
VSLKKHIPTQPYKTTGKIIVHRNEAEDELGQTGLKNVENRQQE